MARKKEITGYALSNIGNVRNKNEDNYLLGHCLNEFGNALSMSYFRQSIGKWTCAGVFDGMGGMNGGEIASYIAASHFQKKTFDIDEMEQTEIERIIEDTYFEAELLINKERKNQRVGGTTGTILLTNGFKCCIFHRGDSRGYLFRNNELQPLTKDHTLAQIKRDLGIYRNEQEIPEYENHQLIEYIGMDSSGHKMKPFETEWISWEEGDKFLLCTDGLYDMCVQEILTDILIKEADLKNASNKMLSKALLNGGRDNVTMVLLDLK